MTPERMSADRHAPHAMPDVASDIAADDAGDVDTQAAVWLARRQDGLDAAEDARFQAWVAADLAHVVAYEQMSALAGRVRGLPDDALAALRAGLQREKTMAVPAAVSPQAPAQHLASPARRTWFRQIGTWVPQASAAVAVLALVGGGWLGWDHWQQQPTFVQAYQTQRGQQLNVALPDGSRLQLDTATRLEVTLYRQRREVRLLEGQAMFSVASVPAGQGVFSDTRLPFTVQAGPLRVAVIGTRFSVRHTALGLDAGGASVAVQEGRVRVSQMLAVGSPIDLSAGQRVTADASGRLGEVSRVAFDAAAPWREGRVSFENTPLAQAVAEFERYGPTGLSVTDPEVASLRIGGSFELRRLDRFAAALPQLLPVRLKRHDGQIEIVSSR